MGLLFEIQYYLPESLNNIQPRLITRIYDRNGAVLMEYYTERRILIPYSEIPPYLIDCLLATEDRKLYDHWGVDSGISDVDKSFFWNFANKWLSADGRDFVCVFTGTNDMDSLNLVRGQFVVVPETNPGN